ncbi:ubiquitin [Sulfuracidifex metallicus]|uniref:ubiquitin n=1 Tax=Sulfuracidifex metallicus TaxID=47303 RepID=UPI0022752D92|nr:ubiquitin [Sulfuracidifex metallicus]MCY0849866.1 ubiquitin [Sulfuracidifex metallicus]
MVKVVLRGPLVSVFNSNEFLVKGGSSLISTLSKIDKREIIVSDGRIKPGYLILINGTDFRLLKKDVLEDSDTVDIIPINHGG